MIRLSTRGAAGACAMLSVAAAALAAAPDDAEPRPIAPAPAAEAPKAPPAGILVEPSGATVELFLRLDGGDGIEALLLRAGIGKSDAAAAAALVGKALPAGLADEAEVAVLLGSGAADRKRLERVSIEAGKAFRLVVGRDRGDRLRLVREALAVDATPRRFQGEVGDDLYWSLRSAGAPAETARDYVEAISTRIDPRRDLLPGDRFDLVIDHLQTASGASRAGPLLYAGLSRSGGRTLDLVRWTAAGQDGWFEPGSVRQRIAGYERPVGGGISSRFGHRVHPILRIGRFHSGVDFAASRGSPVVAAADGTVVMAGWNGGYGRQVRLVHADGLSTSYSHLSSIVAEPGASVRRGQLIGHVGSSGVSTGPHLHYEAHRNGQAIDPLSLGHAVVTSIDPSEQAALMVRLAQLRSI